MSGQQRRRARQQPALAGGALTDDALRGVREERRQVLADRPAGAQERGQHGIQLRAVAGFGQIPRAGAVDVAVRLVRDPPDRVGGTAEVEISQCPGYQARSVPDGFIERDRVRRASRGRDVPAAVSMDHGDDPVDEVAEPVGKLIVGATDEAVDGEVGVGALWHLAQQPPAHRVRAVIAREVVRIDGSAAGFAYLAAVLSEVAVDHYVGGDRFARG